MKFTNRVLNKISTITRKFPTNRKINQLYKHLNKIFLALGADPIMDAKMEDKTKIRVDISTRTERIAFYTGKYDNDLIQIIKLLYNTDGCFLDIGANIGFYSVAMGNHIKNRGNGKVIAFEPFIGNFKRLNENINLNQLNDYCIINNYGLSNISEESQITLREDFKHGSNTGNASIPTSLKMDEGFKTSAIKLERLDDIWVDNFMSFPIIDFIKMDIEGHEDFCLKGGINVISQNRPAILMEVNKPYYEARSVDLDETFLNLIPEGYHIFCDKNSNWIEINSFEECKTIDNVFLIPKERLKLQNYKMFKFS